MTPCQILAVVCYVTNNPKFQWLPIAALCLSHPQVYRSASIALPRFTDQVQNCSMCLLSLPQEMHLSWQMTGAQETRLHQQRKLLLPPYLLMYLAKANHRGKEYSPPTEAERSQDKGKKGRQAVGTPSDPLQTHISEVPPLRQRIIYIPIIPLHKLQNFQSNW